MRYIRMSFGEISATSRKEDAARTNSFVNYPKVKHIF
jgi:hypothetical protein